uniref:CCHC-type domain-containing protein n=1 Tax=Electrophorus electricus TaxID=8005 RepID=A0A4W4E325_ELEEL
MVRDELGIWNGRRQYQMSFKEDGKGGLVHPPALFAIDGNRGYLFYRDQPVFCRSCRGHGHKMEDCPELECLNCLEKGHLARDCRGPRRCRQCRSEGHLPACAHRLYPSCRSYGHKVEDCPNLKCLNCLELGHMARDCKGPRRCRSCRGEGGLPRSPHASAWYCSASGNGAPS